jgi:GNAT superfamily N-acetyltransferase
MSDISFVDVYDSREAGKEFLYRLLALRSIEPDTNISHRELPGYAEHCRFVNSRPYPHWFIISNEQGEWIGYVSATVRNEIGIVMLPQHRRKGYGAAAVKKIMEYHRVEAQPSAVRGTWLANVAPSNHPSHLLFKKLGGKVIQITYELP